MIVNGYVIEDKKVKLSEDGGIYNIELIMWFAKNVKVW